MSQMRIVELQISTPGTTPSQKPKTYILTTNKPDLKDRYDTTPVRIDYLPGTVDHQSNAGYAFAGQVPRKSSYLPFASPSHLLTSFVTFVSTLFLPSGYPHSVTSDYTPYQIYDSLQAFASTIAGLLSSRAVLQSLNVVSTDEHDANAATYATLLGIATNTLSSLTTILFAARAAPRVSVDIKFYRFLADVVNDIAFVLDLLAPSLPQNWAFLFGETPYSELYWYLPVPLIRVSSFPGFIPSPRVLALCCSAVCRAVCGVAGGSSKAVLSSHFAKNSPEQIGELNAKDGSQETVVNLLGMWVGGVLVSRVNGMRATWSWMLGLLFFHLGANWMAVKNITFTWLNRPRAMLVLDKVRRGQNPDQYSVRAIGRQENILGIETIFGLFSEANWQIAATFEDFVMAVGAVRKGSSGSMIFQNNVLTALIEIFANESYILWYDSSTSCTTVLLKQGAEPADQLKACYMSLELSTANITDHDNRIEQFLRIMQAQVHSINDLWPQALTNLERAGWDINATNLETATGVRVQLSK